MPWDIYHPKTETQSRVRETLAKDSNTDSGAEILGCAGNSTVLGTTSSCIVRTVRRLAQWGLYKTTRLSYLINLDSARTNERVQSKPVNACDTK